MPPDEPIGGRSSKRKAPRKQTAEAVAPKPAPRSRRPWRGWLLKSLLVLMVPLIGWSIYLDAIIKQKFEGRRWALPAHVFAQPLTLKPGQALTLSELIDELRDSGYQQVTSVGAPGQYSREGDNVILQSRKFNFWDGLQESMPLKLDFSADRLLKIMSLESAEELTEFRLDPLDIGGVYPGEQEDRILVKLDEVPQSLIDALLASEDRNFFYHYGISIRGTVRALVSNLKSGPTQGGSTLTQQLVKNFFLTSERSLGRKIPEAMMALLLELHYSKQQILEAYINEVHLAQDGNRAIHGFGLASQYFFSRPLSELDPAQTALLVTLVRGSSLYNPIRNPDKALERRNLILKLEYEQGRMDQPTFAAASAQPLGLLQHKANGLSRIPAFLALVRKELQQDYQPDDLTTEGLQIFTSLNPRLQRLVEQKVSVKLAQLEKQQRLPADSLQAAVVMTEPATGDVVAILGGREASYAGFNRALEARRSIGSLAKPFVYLAALARPERYSLVSVLDDSPYQLNISAKNHWQPQNYDHKFRGPVLLRDALMQSLNIPTIRLGMDLGLDEVRAVFARAGIQSKIDENPSLLLGAFGLTPYELAQAYQTLAAQGIYRPLKAVRAVMSQNGQVLNRYGSQAEPVLAPAPVYLLTQAMQRVVKQGSARSLGQKLPQLQAAGKTGTTDDTRDTWFAGFTGDLLALVWVGRDDNKPTRLTGATGALPVWTEIMAAANSQPLVPKPPKDIEFALVGANGDILADSCPGGEAVAFVRNNVPAATPCEPPPSDNPPEAEPEDLIERWFN